MLLAAPFAAARAIEAPSTRPAAVDLFAMGDWGEDTQAQRKVAEQMSRSARGLVNPLTGVVLCGDNFYFRLTGADDPRWQLLFEKMYDPAALGVPFYSCLGNHDCEANNQAIELEYARQNPRSRFKLPGLWYRRDLPVDRPLVTLIMLDSNKDALSELQWNQQISWLRDQLTGPRAAWTICCAHHPLFSNGFFFVNGILQRDWGALFEQHGVDFYLAGHEHNLQHLEIAGWKESFLIAGGGGAHAHPLFRADRGFSRQAFGFLHFAITPERAGVRFIDADGTVIHEFERTRAGQVKQILTTPNSIPERNALKTLLELRNRAPATRP
jgi:hypothetical protein